MKKVSEWDTTHGEASHRGYEMGTADWESVRCEFGAKSGDLSKRVIEKKKVIPLSVGEVWRLWTTTEGMTSWLVDSADIDLQIGGRYELHFMTDAPAGAQGSEGCVVLAYLPKTMLAFSWNAPPMFPTIRELRTWVVVTLHPRDERTHVKVVHLGWPDSGWTDGSEWPEVYDYFDQAWGNVLAELDKYARQGQTAL